MAGAVSGQPGCPCSICDEDQEFGVPETETKRLQIHTPVDPPEMSTASNLRSRLRALRTGVVEWVDPETGQVEIDFLSWRDRWNLFGVHSYDWGWVRSFGKRGCGCTKNPLTRRLVLISWDCPEHCFRFRRKKRKAAHAWRGCCSRNTYALIWAPRFRSWVRVICFGDDDYVALSLDNEVLR